MSWKNTIIASLIMLFTFGLLSHLSRPEEIKPNKPFSTFPVQISDWTGKEDRFDDQVYKVLGVDDSFYADYRNAKGEYINLYIGFYQSQREGDMIHSPKNCMPGGGWNIIESKVVPVQLKAEASKKINVIKLVLQNGPNKQISYYWFQSRGRIISSEYLQKIYLVWDAITKNRTDDCFVRLITPVVASEEEATRSLEKFIQDIFPVLNEYIPS